ncbi:MAG: aldose 1-epimerase [Alphaproteobacteria bacterium]|nr:aldose 1-epimerase [Alphaproteobacteria bacterium]
MQEIILSNKKVRLGILPELGASLSFLTYQKNGDWIDILRPTDIRKDKLDSNQTALFPMLPYCGRIRGGSFTYWGILRKVSKNQNGISDPIHGDGWKSIWTVQKQTDDSLTLTMTHDKKDSGFPFSFGAEITYTLNEGNLDIQLSVRNPSPLPMPCGLGIHPFFVKTKDVELNFKSQVVWSNESDPIFDEPYTTPAAWSFDGGKPLNNAVFDTCFGGFEEQARISYPARDISVDITTSDIFHHVVLFAPKGKNFFCLEPSSNASNAFNLAADGVIGTGIRSIGPNQSLTGNITLKIQG